LAPQTMANVTLVSRILVRERFQEPRGHLILAREIKAISLSDFESLSAQTIEVRKMLYGLRTKVIASPRRTKSDVPT